LAALVLDCLIAPRVRDADRAAIPWKLESRGKRAIFRTVVNHHQLPRSRFAGAQTVDQIGDAVDLRRIRSDRDGASEFDHAFCSPIRAASAIISAAASAAR